ncbi:MAG: hypothetical protein MJK04_11960, partial [Psychrosphaera sp.]|nr:hypothetical protein [Psychrosphaera sp.]
MKTHYKYSLLATVIAAACNGSAVAQIQDNKQAGEKVEQIIVTGSHIRRNTQARSPIDVLDLEGMTGAMAAAVALGLGVAYGHAVHNVHPRAVASDLA